MVGHPWCGGCWRRFVDVHDRRRTRSSPLARPGRRWPLALRAAARALGRQRARQAADQPGGGRAATWGAGVRRVGPRRPYRRVRPLSHEQRPRRVLPGGGRPAMLIPNPFYAAYAAGAVAANCEPVYLPATAATGFLPDLDALSEELLARTVAFFIASPANPQGAVADLAYLTRVVALARRFGFLVFSDECYSEIYTRRAPAGMLEAAGPDFANVIEFQSLSKRSNLPGLRIGFAAGDRQFLASFLELRNVSAPQVPMSAQRVAIAAYGDEAHVEENRRLYAQKFDLADQIIGD